MKLVFALLLLSTQAMAEVVTCLDPKAPLTEYILTEKLWPVYELTIVVNKLDPASCRTRWGCDYIPTVVYSERMETLDYQGALVFKGKRTHIDMEDMDHARYTTNSTNDRFS